MRGKNLSGFFWGKNLSSFSIFGGKVQARMFSLIFLFLFLFYRRINRREAIYNKIFIYLKKKFVILIDRDKEEEK